jgi:polysaccharide chain length determinant protein (PEP-CTERM system associated)
MVWVSGLSILAIFWVVMALPNQYSSYATVLVEPQAIDEELVRAGVQGQDLQQRLGIMSARILSRQRLSKLIDELGLYPEESKELTRQEVIDIMRRHLSVEPVLSELQSDKRSTDNVEFNRFKISYRNRSAVTAAQVAQSLASDFVDANINARIEVSQQSLSFMEDSIEELRNQAVGVESRIKNVKAENAGHLPEDLVTNQRIFEQLIAQSRETQRALLLARSDEAFWKSQVITAESMMGTGDATSPAYRMKLIETELQSLRARGYTQKHPDVVHRRDELALLQQNIQQRQAEASDDSADSADAESDSAGDSYAEQNAKSELRRARLAVEAAEQELERLATSQEEVQESIALTPLVAEQLNSLEREYESLVTSFRDFSVRRQQASVQANLERKQLGENFRILESAFPAARPGSPNRILMLFVGVIIGLGAGVAMGLVLETSDSSIHDARRLQTYTNMPVLVSIPSIRLDPDRRLRRRRLLLELVIAGVISLFFLAGGLVSYVYVNRSAPAKVEEASDGAPRREASSLVPDESGSSVVRGLGA